MTAASRIDDLKSGAVTYLADGGLETDMIFLRGFDLPLFASFTLLDDPRGRRELRNYYEDYIRIAKSTGQGMILDTPTWRASQGWGAQMDLDQAAMDAVNLTAVEFISALREDHEEDLPILLNGAIGPEGDGYNPERVLSVQDYETYHGPQVRALARAGVDLVTAVTMTNANEGLAIARLAKSVGKPCIIGFTVETDGRLPTGETMQEAIERVDADTKRYPIFFMINCAHPDHFRAQLDGDWLTRIGAVRANASRMSHAELDEAEELDPGNPAELAQDYVDLRALLPNLRVMGGCCGTDHRHVGAIAHACHGRHSHAA